MKEGQQGPNDGDNTTNVQGCITCVKKKKFIYLWHDLYQLMVTSMASVKDNVSFQDVHYKNIKVFCHLISGLKHFEDMTSSAFKCK